MNSLDRKLWGFKEMKEKNTLPSFRETPWGYQSTSRDNAHTYAIVFNSIDYDVTHYWEGNPNGEFLGTSTSPAQMARTHYQQLSEQ